MIRARPNDQRLAVTRSEKKIGRLFVEEPGRDVVREAQRCGEESLACASTLEIEAGLEHSREIVEKGGNPRAAEIVGSQQPTIVALVPTHTFAISTYRSKSLLEWPPFSGVPPSG